MCVCVYVCIQSIDSQPSPEELEPQQQQQQQVDKEKKQPCSKLLSEEPKQNQQEKKKVDNESEEPMPIPPPRRKRTTKQGRTVCSIGSESSSTDAALTSPEEPLSPSADTPTHSSALTSETGTKQQGGHISNGTTPLFITAAGATTSGSHDPGRTHPQSATTEMCRSLSNDDVFTNLKEETLKSLPTDRTTVRRRSLPHIDEDNRSESTLKGSVRTSHTSMAVMSSGSAPYQRPYSVIVSPFDVSREFSFPDDKQVSLTVPRNQNGVMVWYSPHVSLKAQKSPMPESSEFSIYLSNDPLPNVRNCEPVFYCMVFTLHYSTSLYVVCGWDCLL